MNARVAAWPSAALTHPGRRRRLNEDAVLARPELRLWLVADGLGGHEAGDVASALVRDNVARLERLEPFSAFVDRLEDTLRVINLRLVRVARERFGGRTMGCTVVALAVEGHLGVCLWAGDSRLYRLRNGAAEQVTRDHNPVGDAVERGELTEAEAASLPDSSVITRALGAGEELHLDCAVVDVAPGDTLLLCSDGLYREVAPDEFAGLLAGPDVRAGAQALLDLALERGARDNVSVVACRVPG